MHCGRIITKIKDTYILNALKRTITNMIDSKFRAHMMLSQTLSCNENEILHCKVDNGRLSAPKQFNGNIRYTSQYCCLPCLFIAISYLLILNS